MTFGARVKSLRQKYGMTQTLLAEELGISASLMAKLEQDRTWPSDRMRVVIAAYFGVSLAVLRRDSK